MRNRGRKLGFASCLCLASLSASDLTVTSPDGRLSFELSWTGLPRLEYSVMLAGKPVIGPSPAGIVVDRENLGVGAKGGKVDRYQVDQSYPWYGPHSTAIDKCNGATIAMTHKGVAYTFETRAYNDGIAFRQIVPGTGARVPDEAISFRLPAGSTIWYHDLNDHYEGTHIRKGLAALPADQWVAPPMTFKLAGGLGYAAITEAALVNYSGMALQYDGNGGFDARLGHSVPASWPFRLRFKEDVERMAQPAAVQGTITTPWRVVLAGPDLNTLVNSDIVHNLATPPSPKLFPDGLKTDWIKPGRALWSYLDGGNGTLEGMKEFSKLAGELGFEYNLLEGFWSRWTEAQLKELVDYSRERGVRIMIWSSRKPLQDPQKMRDFFEMCRRTGVAGAKIDFFDHENKEIVDLYETLLKTAAEYKLVLDFHGANKPTGNERTWPNEIGHEGIRGVESRAPWAEHEATLPFTRLLAGLADYTPMHFGKKLGDTTWAHQIANAVILQAPLLCYAAHPANILANPAVELIRDIPSTWDETIVLPPSEIGDVAVFARRKGGTWFLAAINGPNAKTFRVDLSFLGAGTGRSAASYQAMLVSDTGEATAVKVERQTMSGNDSLYVNLRSGGGFVARFVK